MSHETLLRIAARHSDLARLQAYRVGDALRASFPTLEIRYSFRASLGDQNQTDPLWKMPEKGVFTEDFVRDLHEGSADLVVHSWKDLPTEVRPGLTIAATLPRADQRDLFIFKKSSLARLRETGRLRILTSSPRRAYNLDPFFRAYLPFAVSDVQFENVRGNIPTRLRKLLEGDEDGLIVAKAALDRLLEAAEPEFKSAQEIITKSLRQTRQMVLPLALNPTAAAQGALAVEIRADRTDLSEMLSKIHSAATFAAVVREREILSSYGGGCHQKIGVSVLDRAYGRITFLKGLTDRGETLNTLSLDTEAALPKCEGDANLFPRAEGESSFFDRDPRPRGQWSDAESATHLFVARETAWPDGFRPREDAVIFTSGLKTWQRLSQKGVWVTGSTESLGENERTSFSTLSRALFDEATEDTLRWTKLTHETAARQTNSEMASVATYALKPSATPPDLKSRTHFYWMSGTAFDRACELNPEILSPSNVHASGAGHTHEHLKKRLPKGSIPFVYLSVDQFRQAALS